MTCPSCGKNLKQGQLICPKCGKDIELVSEFPVESLLESTENREKEKKSQTSARYNKIIAQSRDNTLRKKQRKLITFITILLVILAIGLVIGVRYYTKYRQLNDYNYQFSHARASYDNGNKDEAYTYIRQALELDPNSEAANLFYANMLAKDGEENKAEELYLQLIKANSDDTDAYQALLELYESQSRPGDMKSLIKSGSSAIQKYFSSYIPKAPETSLEEGSYTAKQTVELKADSGETIYYTLDGTTPDSSSTVYKTGIELDEGRTELRAVAYNEYGISGDVTIAVYNITLARPDAAIIYPSSGKYDAGTKIVVTIPDGCTGFYTFDGTPDDTCEVVNGPIVMQEGTHIFSVIVKNEYGKYSSIASETYIVGNS